MSEENRVSENPEKKEEVTETLNTEAVKQENASAAEEKQTTDHTEPVKQETVPQSQEVPQSQQNQGKPAAEKTTEPQKENHPEEKQDKPSEDRKAKGTGNVPPKGSAPASGPVKKPEKKHKRVWKIVLKYVLVFLVAGCGAFGGSYAAIRVAENQQEREMQNAFRSFGSQLPFGGGSGNSQTQSDGPALGITIQQTDDGIEIVGFADNSNAEKAGLKQGDIIMKVDGKEYDSVSDISSYISSKKVGDTVKVTVKRDNAEKTYSVKLVKKDLSAYSIPSQPEGNDEDSSTPKALPGTSGENSGLQG